MKHVLVLAGTRPEAIKVIPVVRALREMSDAFSVTLCASGQHNEMLHQAFADFGVSPDADLSVMEPSQTLAHLSARLFRAIDEIITRTEPDCILVQGDTTTALVAALCAFYRHIPVGHIEAGLRSHDMDAPFPEEMNRRTISLAARWHFAPTEHARKNLLEEQVAQANIYVTGNTVVDALLEARSCICRNPPALPPNVEARVAAGQRIVLVTAHRRENFGPGLRNICEALRMLAAQHRNVTFIYPMHLNPAVTATVRSQLGQIVNVILEAPLSYRSFVRLMDASYLLLTDSGGMQEEGPVLGKPVLVMREKTERPEGVAAGTCKLIGLNSTDIYASVNSLLMDSAIYDRMATAKNPYGDGTAGRQIANVLRNSLIQ